MHAFVDVGDTFLQSRDHDRVSVVQPDAGPHDIAIEYPWRAGYEAKSVPIYMWSYCISEQKHQFQRKVRTLLFARRPKLPWQQVTGRLCGV